MEFEINYNVVLGKGSFGEVYLAHSTNPNNTKCYAAKMIRDSDKNNLDLMIKREIATHEKLNHKNIVKLVQAYKVKSTEKGYCLITELCRDGTLNDFLYSRTSHLSESFIVFVIRSIVNAFRHIHLEANTKGNRIIHRDLKPDNIFFDKGNFKLADFGMATEANLKSSNIGTFTYMAPELVDGDEIITDKSDVFSLGR
jgi:serine/threonine protein kinase